MYLTMRCLQYNFYLYLCIYFLEYGESDFGV